jgi:hypothetical protein
MPIRRHETSPIVLEPPRRFPRLLRVLDGAYEPVADVAGMRIYQRRVAACPTLPQLRGPSLQP